MMTSGEFYVKVLRHNSTTEVGSEIGHVDITKSMSPYQVGQYVNNIIDRHTQGIKLAEQRAAKQTAESTNKTDTEELLVTLQSGFSQAIKFMSEANELIKTLRK